MRFSVHQQTDVAITSIVIVQGLAIRMMLSVEGSAGRVTDRWIDSLVCSLALREGVCNPVPQYQYFFVFVCIFVRGLTQLVPTARRKLLRVPSRFHNH